MTQLHSWIAATEVVNPFLHQLAPHGILHQTPHIGHRFRLRYNTPTENTVYGPQPVRSRHGRSSENKTVYDRSCTFGCKDALHFHPRPEALPESPRGRITVYLSGRKPFCRNIGNRIIHGCKHIALEPRPVPAEFIPVAEKIAVESGSISSCRLIDHNPGYLIHKQTIAKRFHFRERIRPGSRHGCEIGYLGSYGRHSVNARITRGPHFPQKIGIGRGCVLPATSRNRFRHGNSGQQENEKCGHQSFHSARIFKDSPAAKKVVAGLRFIFYAGSVISGWMRCSWEPRWLSQRRGDGFRPRLRL